MKVIFNAVTTESAKILGGAGRRVVLEDTGNGFYIVRKISHLINPNIMVSTGHMSIFLKTGQFASSQS